MQIVREHFDELFFTESTVEASSVSGATLTIHIRNVFAMKDYPTTGEILSGRLVFKGAASSRRTVTEYIGDPRKPDGFQPAYGAEESLPAAALGEELREYEFEGLQEAPCAWIDNWVIRAASFEFEIDEMRPFGELFRPQP